MRKPSNGLDRIKDLLKEWADWQHEGYGRGYPSRVSFSVERVQSDIGSITPIREMPDIVKRLDAEIERLAPAFKRILGLEFCDRRPQRVKAAVIGIPQSIFSLRLTWAMEQLDFAMWGDWRHAA